MLKEIENRRSIIVFNKKEIEKEKLDSMMESAMYAPSCYNKQPWNYTFVRKNDSSRKKLEKALSDGNKWAKGADMLVVVSVDFEDGCNVNNIKYAIYDAGLSVMSFVIEGVHQNIFSHQMAGWSSDDVSSAISLPKNQSPIIVIAIGYQETDENILDDLPNDIKAKMDKKRIRKPKSENFFFGKFGSF